MLKADLIEYDALGQAELIKNGDIKSSELVELTIERIEKINPKINSVIYKMYDEARKLAEKWDKEISTNKKIDAPFSGVPFLLKDICAEYKGTPYYAGAKLLEGYISEWDSELVKRQKAAGLIIVGKTNTPEFGIPPTTEPVLFGPTRNPWNLNIIAGGSSGGSAAAVAAGIVPMAHGNDGGGSIRIPASCCGVFGLKPTRARNPLGPRYGDIGSGMVVEHALTRTVRDSAALLDATSGPDLGDPYYAPHKKRPYLEEIRQEVGRLKIGFLTSIPKGWSFTTKIHPDCENAVRDAAHLCEKLEHNVVEVNPKELSHKNLFQTFSVLFTSVSGSTLTYIEKELGSKITEDQVEPLTWLIYKISTTQTASDYLLALEECQLFSRKLAQWYHNGGYDLFLTPTLTIPPVKIGTFTSENMGKIVQIMNQMAAFTSVFNSTGQPAMSVPLYWSTENIPIGIQFAAPFGDEATLFRLAAQLEQERPWTNRKPPIFCGESSIL
ncbi:MAG: amidase [Promethearchaeota archaeon]|nr:MAG: amidase [Candidatus Lokiarchaeota archaeon]